MLLSRVADSLYWMGRYLERAEHLARLIDVRLDLGLDRRPNGWNFSRALRRREARAAGRDACQSRGARRRAHVRYVAARLGDGVS